MGRYSSMPMSIIDNKQTLTLKKNPLVGVLGFGPNTTFLYTKFVYCQ